MKEQLISLEVAKLAKEKGFDQNPYNIKDAYLPRYTDGSEIVLNGSLYNPQYNIAVAPTQSLLQKWLREKHDIHLVCWWYDKENKFYIEIGRKTEANLFVQNGDITKLFKTYEEALEEGLKRALTLINNV